MTYTNPQLNPKGTTQFDKFFNTSTPNACTSRSNRKTLLACIDFNLYLPFRSLDLSRVCECDGYSDHSSSGAAVTDSRSGQFDLAVALLNNFVEAARIHCSINPTVPVIADADIGFGGPNMIARTVTQYARVGIVGLHIEDQV
ncbi:hypothetical protein C8J55DRAFT_551602 [Lentinula edodes]|uniref:Methylisocitrate lyase n=1 Tax=Lentinula lateritia TaxID=40482 RepID=A0A9W8ZXP6_9AGAR|nr:hypothetical protein C8J55DRAFT_551602 [Lentinula edodes]